MTVAKMTLVELTQWPKQLMAELVAQSKRIERNYKRAWFDGELSTVKNAE